MGAIGQLIQEHKDSQAYTPSSAAIAAAVGVSRSAIGEWIAGVSMPKPDHLRRLSTVIGVPYLRVLDAALTDAGYLPKDVTSHDDSAPNTPAGESPASTRGVSRTPGTSPARSRARE